MMAEDWATCLSGEGSRASKAFVRSRCCCVGCLSGCLEILSAKCKGLGVLESCYFREPWIEQLMSIDGALRSRHSARYSFQNFFWKTAAELGNVDL